MLALYRASHLLSYWVAHSDRLGWVMFPARPNGWKERKTYNGDTAGLMRIPERLGFNTGFPHPDATPVRALHEHIFDEVAAHVRRKIA
jgi:hypothetical protein